MGLKKERLLYLALLSLILIPAVSAVTLYSPLYGLNIGAVYQRNDMLIDSLLLIVIFIGVTQFSLERHFGKERSGRAVVIGVGVSLAIAAIYWEYRSGFRLVRLGPIAMLILGLVIGMLVYNIIKLICDHAAMPTAFIVTYMTLTSTVPNVASYFGRFAYIWGFFNLLMVVAVIMLIIGVMRCIWNVPSWGDGGGGGSPGARGPQGPPGPGGQGGQQGPPGTPAITPPAAAPHQARPPAQQQTAPAPGQTTPPQQPTTQAPQPTTPTPQPASNPKKAYEKPQISRIYDDEQLLIKTIRDMLKTMKSIVKNIKTLPDDMKLMSDDDKNGLNDDIKKLKESMEELEEEEDIIETLKKLADRLMKARRKKRADDVREAQEEIIIMITRLNEHHKGWVRKEEGILYGCKKLVDELIAKAPALGAVLSRHKDALNQLAYLSHHNILIINRLLEKFAKELIFPP